MSILSVGCADQGLDLAVSEDMVIASLSRTDIMLDIM